MRLSTQLAAAAAVATALFLPACGAPGGGGTGQATAPGGGAATTATAEGSPAPEKVVATRTSTDDDIPLELQINELKRQESLLTLNFTVKNNSQPRDPSAPNSATRGGNWQVAGFFDDGQSPPGDISQLNTLDGIYLIDQANRKKYPVVHDSKGVCVCSGNLGSTFVDVGQSVRFYATFGAPPQDVDRVDVAVPHFGTITGVPIE